MGIGLGDLLVDRSIEVLLIVLFQVPSKSGKEISQPAKIRLRHTHLVNDW